MGEPKRKRPTIHQLYRRFLNREDSAGFVRAVSQIYTSATLHRLATGGDRLSRRAAILAISYLGGRESMHSIGHALQDSDRIVRLLAEDGIRAVWFRAGESNQMLKLQRVARLNSCGQFELAAELATQVINADLGYAEAWNQRAIAAYGMHDYYEAIADCQATLELNPYHFPAATGLAHCYLEMDDQSSALEAFRLALKIYPDSEYARSRIRQLIRSLELDS